MNQLILFDSPANIARKSDPQTSHEAAEKTHQIRHATVERCYAILKAAGEPLTADEIGFRAVDEFFRHLEKFGPEYIKQVSNHRKRAHEMHNIFDLAEVVEGQKRNGSRLMKLKEPT